MVKKWHWWTPFTQREFYADAFNIAPEAKALVGSVAAPLGEAAAKPLIPLAWTAGAIAVTLFVFRKPIIKALK